MSKAGKTKKAAAPPAEPATVKQCLTWPEKAGKSKGKKANGSGPTGGIKSGQSADKPASQTRKPCCQLGANFEQPVKEQTNDKEVDDGTVSEALRGWPKKKVVDNEIDMNAYYAQNENDDVNAEKDPDLRNISRSKRATFVPPKKEKKHPVVEEGGPSMGDLMAYRFHREYEDDLKKQKEKEAKKKSKQSGEDKVSRERSKITNNIKANKSGQLRSISLAEKVDQSAHDLWQMNKFKNAKAKISSKRFDDQSSASADEAVYSKFDASYAVTNGNHVSNGNRAHGNHSDDDYPLGMDMPANQASPPTGYYQDGGLDSVLSYYDEE